MRLKTIDKLTGEAYNRRQFSAASVWSDARHFRANLLLGRIRTLRGEPAAAVPYLKMAVEVQPSSSEAKQFLAAAIKAAG